MAEILIEKAACVSCGAAVRDGSAFCFNCGESLVPEPPPPPILKPTAAVVRDPLREEISQDIDSEPPPVMQPAGGLELPKSKFEKSVQAVKRPSGKARRTVLDKKKPSEIEWVERPLGTARLLISALILALIGAGLVAAAYYLR
jgi:hypothetical protein